MADSSVDSPSSADPRVLRMLTYLRRGQPERAVEIVHRAIALVSPERVYLELLIPLVVITGELCLAGHLEKPRAEAIVEQVRTMFDLPRVRLVPQPRLGKRLYATYVPGDVFGVGLVAICHWLERDGWDVVFPFPPVPAERLAADILAAKPDVLALSVRFARYIVNARRLIAGLRQAGFDKPIWLGGVAVNAAPDLFVKSGATYTARDILEFTRRLGDQHGYRTGTPADLLDGM